MSLTAIVLDTPDPRALAAFYRALLGWPAVDDGAEWVTLRGEGGGPGLSFQREPRYASGRPGPRPTTNSR